MRANPFDGRVYAGYGDNKTGSGIYRSSDYGETWNALCVGSQARRSVDTDFDPSGYGLFGTDTELVNHPAVQRIDLASRAITALADLTGPWVFDSFG